MEYNNNCQSVMNPCPCCDFDVTLMSAKTLTIQGNFQNYYFVQCPNCGYGSIKAYFSIDDSIKEWNRFAII